MMAHLYVCCFYALPILCIAMFVEMLKSLFLLWLFFSVSLSLPSLFFLSFFAFALFLFPLILFVCHVLFTTCCNLYRSDSQTPKHFNCKKHHLQESFVLSNIQNIVEFKLPWNGQRNRKGGATPPYHQGLLVKAIKQNLQC